MASVIPADTPPNGMPIDCKVMKRSDSPTQPKDEAASPVGATGSSDSEERKSLDENLNGGVTDRMVKEEQEMYEQTVKEEEESIKQARESIITEEMKDLRKQRLAYILERSSTYANYLAGRIEQQREAEAAREERKKKKAAKQKEKEAKAQAEKKDDVKKEELVVPEPVETRRSTRNSPRVQSNLPAVKKPESPKKKGRKRKAGENHKISDFFGGVMDVKRRKTENDQSSQKEDVKPDVQDVKYEIKEEAKDAEPKDEPTTTTVKEEKGERYINGEKVDPAQPNLFTGGVLRPYQIKGFKWLSDIYQHGINGILADEMGLGKTIQCIALISYLVERGVPGPFLVVAPLSTVPNWVSEFSRFAPDIPVVLYHGSKDERKGLRKKIKYRRVNDQLKVLPVIITSYEVAMADSNFIKELGWRHMIVDEGHRIKNFQCKLITALKTYDSSNRLLLTGTPLQNNLAELWSLLNFLLPQIFDDLGSFEMWFDIDYLEKESGAHSEIAADEQKNNMLSTLHKILAPFVLRRLKSDVDLIIPPKREVLVYAPLSALQDELYRTTVDKSIRFKVEEKLLVEPELDENNRKKRRSKISVNYKMMMEDGNEDKPVKNKKKEEEEVDAWVDAIEKHHQNLADANKKKTGPKTSVVKVQLRSTLCMLKKACNHPYLIEYPLTKDEQFRIDEELVSHSGKLMLLDKMLIKLKEKGHKVLIFSQMTQILDILQDYCFWRQYKMCRLDGSYKLEERRDQIDSFNKDPEMFIFLLSTRAGGLGINLTAADTVVIFDSDWNPQCDLQAQDRCHRIGQTKPVMVYRLITRNTVDQKIVERAAAKRKLEKMVMFRKRFRKDHLNKEELTKAVEPIDPEELIRMLEEKDYDDVMNREVISDHDLERLLDRSALYRAWNKTLKKEDVEIKEEPEDDFTDVKGVFQLVDTDMGGSTLDE